ncbi:MAG: zinc ribbon domain-containing protein [Anaerolineae bacterium]|jgi:hypothetical protein
MDKKNPISAGILNLLIAGLGHAYLRNWGRAIATFVVVPLAAFLAVGLITVLTESANCIWLAVFLFLGGLFVDGYQAAKAHNSQLPTRKCPYCAELIREEARVCKHCGRDLEGAESEQPSVTSSESTAEKADEDRFAWVEPLTDQLEAEVAQMRQELREEVMAAGEETGVMTRSFPAKGDYPEAELQIDNLYIRHTGHNYDIALWVEDRYIVVRLPYATGLAMLNRDDITVKEMPSLPESDDRFYSVRSHPEKFDLLPPGTTVMYYAMRLQLREKQGIPLVMETK